MLCRTVRLALACAATLAALALPARAELGPCKPDTDEMMLCGAGMGAARTIPGTLSPNKKFAFAWHDPASDPDEVENFGNEFLLIRLADGAALAKAPTDYFRNAKGHANRRSESALWSADSRLVVRRYDTRYDTEAFTLYRLGKNGRLAGETNLLRIVEPVVRAKVKDRGRDVANYAFSISNQDDALGKDGTLRFDATLFVVKGDIEAVFNVVMKIAADGGAHIVSIKEDKEQEDK